ncbi:hypothetical protein Droror1_Dr00013997 [Drosera rotundifolia]
MFLQNPLVYPLNLSLAHCGASEILRTKLPTTEPHTSFSSSQDSNNHSLSTQSQPPSSSNPATNSGNNSPNGNEAPTAASPESQPNKKTPIWSFVSSPHRILKPESLQAMNPKSNLKHTTNRTTTNNNHEPSRAPIEPAALHTINTQFFVT